MRFRSYIWFVTTLFVCLYSFFAMADDGATGTVNGVIFEAEHHTPMPHAVVFSIDEPEAVVEVFEGVFTMHLHDGKHRLAVHLGNAIAATLGEVDVLGGYVSEVVASVSSKGEVINFDAESLSRDEAQEEERALVDNGPLSLIEGKVVNNETGEPIAGVKVYVRGISSNAESDTDGVFTLEVPVGTWDLSALHQQYSTVSKPGVRVIVNNVTMIELEMTPMGVALADFLVTAPRIEGGNASLMEERKESSAVEDSIGAEQMSKSGDSNAAGALKRVTGITVVGGKYIYVRGLGERYSSTLFNGAMLPSPEPERRVIPLDMFPAGMLESVVVQKSYSPDMPGEFGGGVVMLRSRNYPEEFVFDVSFGGGMTTGTTFSQGWRGPEGPSDWLGIDGGYRSFPSEFVKKTKDSDLALASVFFPDGFSEAELADLAKMVPQQWKMYKETVPPDWGVTLAIGNSFDLGRKVKLGALASGMYDSSWSNIQKDLTIYNLGEGQQLERFHKYKFLTSTNEIQMAGFVALGLEFDESHSVRTTTMITRMTDNMARMYTGYNRDVGGDIRVTRLRWVERQLFAQQVMGEHIFKELKGAGFDWRYTFSLATRLEPLRRTYRYDLINEENNLWEIAQTAGGNQIFDSNLDDRTHDMGGELKFPIAFDDQNELKLTAGGALMVRHREVDARRYKFNTKQGNAFPTGNSPLTWAAEDLFVDELMGAYTADDGMEYAGLRLVDYTAATDNYFAKQEIMAGYGKAELMLMKDLKLMAGARFEHSDQRVTTYELFSDDPEEIKAKLATNDILPAGTASWSFGPDMVLRGGYGRTVSRPEFRELSEAHFHDVTGGRETWGNPSLKRATIDNFDLRWDWFWRPGEILSTGFFYKHFEQPIETKLVNTSQIGKTWANAEAANNFGVEFDIKRSFDWISDKLQDFYFAGNASFVYSRVELANGGVQTSKARALEGQSPYVLNAQLGWDSLNYDTSIIFLYNVYGRRIAEPGSDGVPDAYEEAFHQLKFVAKKKFWDKMGLSFKIDNILNQRVKFTIGDKISQRYSPGVSFSLGLSYTH